MDSSKKHADSEDIKDVVKPYPVLLKPSGKDYLWGGEKLKKLYGKSKYEELEALHPLAETWECSVHPDGPSWAVNGALRGQSLAEIITSHPEFVGSKFENAVETSGAEAFPILIKFIDAAEDLSVQVHPSDEYAKEKEGQTHGKTEMWYVLHAESGAHLVWGFEHAVSASLLNDHIKSRTISADLHYEEVHKGDVFLIEAGTVHALGRGVIVAEIQESSNLTYRIYDYNRSDKDGNPRPLHFDKACDVLNMGAVDETVTRQKPRIVHYFYGCSREVLVRCRYFEVEKITVTKGFSFTIGSGSFQVLLCIAGEGGVEYEESYSTRLVRFEKGSCIFLPANLGRSHVTGECQFLKVRC